MRTSFDQQSNYECSEGYCCWKIFDVSFVGNPKVVEFVAMKSLICNVSVRLAF